MGGVLLLILLFDFDCVNAMSMHGTAYASPRFLKGNACQLLQHSMIVASV